MIEELLTALIVGLLVAFALQVLLTLLGVAIGMSVVAIRANADSSEGDAKLGFWAGFGVLLTVNTVLFAACFLASRFSLAQSPIVGAIEGIVIWAAYLLILIWLSSTAVSSVVGSLLSVTIGGFRNLLYPIKSLFAKSLFTNEEPQAITVAEMRTAVRQEVQTVFEPDHVQNLIRAELQQFFPQGVGEQSARSAQPDQAANDQIANTEEFRQSEPSPQERIHLTLAALQQQLVTFLQQSDKLTLKRVDRRLHLILDAAQSELPEGILLPDLDRSLALHLLVQRKDLSEKQRGKIFNQLQETWSEVRQARQMALTAETPSEVEATQSTSAQQFTEIALKTLVDQLPDSLKENILKENIDLDRLAQQLPELIQQAGNQLPSGLPTALSTSAGLAMLTMALAKGKDLLPENGIDLQQIRQSLDRLMEQSGISEVSHGVYSVVEQVDQLRDRSMEQVGQQIEQVQQTVQEQVSQIKTQIQTQTNETVQKTQRAATIAAWWLFLTVLTGAISSAVAGAAANLVFI